MTSVDERPVEKKPRINWRSFSIRTLLLVMTVFGIWLGLRVEAARRQKRAVEEITKLGGWVRYDYQFDSDGEELPEGQSWVPEWILKRTGEDLFHHVVEVNMVYHEEAGRRSDNTNETDAIKHQLPALPRLRRLLLHDDQTTDDLLKAVSKLRYLEELYCWRGLLVTDAGVAHLRNLPRLRFVHLSNAGITDESLRTFGSMKQVEELSLQMNPFTDAGLAHLSEHDQLTSLAVDLGNTNITDAGLKHLESLDRLEMLSIQQTHATPEGVERLKRAVPSLKTVNYSPRPPGPFRPIQTW